MATCIMEDLAERVCDAIGRKAAPATERVPKPRGRPPETAALVVEVNARRSRRRGPGDTLVVGTLGSHAQRAGLSRHLEDAVGE